MDMDQVALSHHFHEFVIVDDRYATLIPEQAGQSS
jgi:hypothetical protein